MSRPAGIDEIVAIMGLMPDSTAATIAALGATAEELAEARALARRHARPMPIRHPTS